MFEFIEYSLVLHNLAFEDVAQRSLGGGVIGNCADTVCIDLNYSYEVGFRKRCGT